MKMMSLQGQSSSNVRACVPYYVNRDIRRELTQPRKIHTKVYDKYRYDIEVYKGGVRLVESPRIVTTFYRPKSYYYDFKLLKRKRLNMDFINENFKFLMYNYGFITNSQRKAFIYALRVNYNAIIRSYDLSDILPLYYEFKRHCRDHNNYYVFMMKRIFEKRDSIFGKRMVKAERIKKYMDRNYNMYWNLKNYELDCKESDDDFDWWRESGKYCKKKKSINYDVNQLLPEDYDSNPRFEEYSPRKKSFHFLNILRGKVEYLKCKYRISKFSLLNTLTIAEGMIDEIPMVDLSTIDEADEVQPEMEEPEQPTVERIGQTVLTTLTVKHEEQPIEDITDDFWIKSSISDKLVDQPHASEMPILMPTVTWSHDALAGHFLVGGLDDKMKFCHLPYYVVKTFFAHPAVMMFNQFAYWKGDMVIKVKANTNPFHTGQLVVAFYYGQDFDAARDLRMNVANMLLLPHVILDASVGNEVELRIPFRSYRSLLSTMSRSGNDKELYVGTLSICVLTPLACGDKTTNVSLYIYVQFENNQFAGAVPRIDRVEAQMMPIKRIMKMAESGLHLVNRVADNMDNPPIVTPPLMYTPQTSDSWSTGMGDVQNVHVLRLDPSGQTQHPLGSSTTERDTLISNIVGKWGLLARIKWDDSHAVGKQLMKFDATPDLAPNEFYPAPFKLAGVEHQCVVLPPVSAISQLFGYWRGTLEYRFDIVNSRFHTGSLIVGYYPSVDTDVALNDIMGTYNAVMDVGNTKSYIFKVPYMAERPWYPRYRKLISGDTYQVDAPGKIYLFVMNRLTTTDSASNLILINVYVKGGVDFEVAIPSAPLIAPIIDSNFVVPGVKEVWPKVGYYPDLWLGTWRYLPTNKVLVRYGAATDHVTQWTKCLSFAIYKPSTVVADNFVGVYWRANANAEAVLCSYFCRVIVNDDKDTYNYMTAFDTEAKAIDYIKAWNNGVNDELSNSPGSSLMSGYDTQTVGVFKHVVLVLYKVFARKYNVQPQMEVQLDPMADVLLSSQNGRLFYGESFKDLKDYMRRFQIYTYFEYDLTKTDHSGYRLSTHVSLPLTPIGLDINDQISTTHVGREGVIPYMMNMFRFYRGGLRFKIMVFGPDDVVTTIQHKHDVVRKSRVPVIFKNEPVLPADTIQTAYAMTVINNKINNVATIEIPFYNPTNLGLLQLPNRSISSEINAFTMGCLDFNFLSKENKRIMVFVYYSIADDMDVSCFIGNGPMVELTSVYSEPSSLSTGKFILSSDVEEILQDEIDSIQPEMEAPSVSQISVEQVEDNVRQLNAENEEEVATEPDNRSIFERMRDSVAAYMMPAYIRQTRANLGLDIEDETHNNITSLMGDWIKKQVTDHRYILHTIFFSIMQIIANPKRYTFAISLLAILTAIEIDCCGLSAIMACFGSSVEPQSDNQDKTENWFMRIFNLIRESLVGFFGKIVGMTQMMGSCIKENMPDFESPKWKTFRNVSFTIAGMLSLLKLIFEMIPKLVKFISKYVKPKEWARSLFYRESEYVKKWIVDAEMLLSVENLDSSKNNPAMADLLHICCIVGRDLMMKYTRSDLDIKNIQYIKLLNERLHKLREEAVFARYLAPVRIEPFCFALMGDSQIGKSYTTDLICEKLLESINYSTHGQLIYTRNYGSKFWSGAAAQPVCKLDDFLHVKTTPSVQEAVMEFVHLKSSVDFCPPQAEIERKHIKFNPLIVAVTQNEPYPKIADLADDTAWMNRREVMIKYCLKEQYKGTPVDDIDPEITGKMDHVYFQIYRYRNNDPERAGHSNAETIFIEFNGTTKLTWEQMLNYVTEKFKVKYAKYVVDYKRRVDIAFKFQPQIDNSVRENIQSYKKYIDRVAESINAIDRHFISDLERKMKNQVCDECLRINCVCIRAEAPETCNASWHEGMLFDDGGNTFIILFDKEEKKESIVRFDALPKCQCYVDHIQVLIGRFKDIYGEQTFLQFLPVDVAKYYRAVMMERDRELQFSRLPYIKKMKVTLKKFLDNVTDTSLYVCEKLVNFIKLSLLIVSMLSILMMFKFLWDNKYNCLGCGNSKCICAQMAYSDKIPKAQEKKLVEIKKIDGLKKIEAQMADTTFEATKNVIGRNTFFISFGEGCKNTRVRCVGISGRYFLAIDHYCHAMDRAAMEGATFDIIRAGVVTRLPYRLIKWFKFKDSAVVLGLLPKMYFGAFRDIRNFISKVKRVDNMSPNCYYVEPRIYGQITKENAGSFELNIYKEKIAFLRPQISIPSVVDGIENTIVHNVYEYGICGKGKCGGLVLTDSNVNDPIIGIHVAGMTSGTKGYAEALTREMFDILDEDYYKNLSDGIQAECDEIYYNGRNIDLISTSNASLFIPYGVDVMGCVPRKFGHRSPPKSTQVHTECYNQITMSTYDFPMLLKNDVRNTNGESPMLKGCLYHADPPDSFYHDGLYLCYTDLRDKILAKVNPRRINPGILTIEQSIVGIPDLKGYDAMELDTSEGFPFISDRPKGASDKRWLFDLRETNNGYQLMNLDHRVIEVMQYKNDLRKKGIVPITVFTDCLKDIKLPKEKLWPRIFSISPVDFTIQFRQYFMDFTVAYQEAMFDVESGVGIDTDSMQWTDMVYRLLNNSNNFVCGDYSKFGPRLMSVCVYYAFCIIIDWYQLYTKQLDVDRLIRLCMAYEITYAVHLMYNFVYRVYCGAPSGSPITTILNTIVNGLYFRYCWWSVAPEVETRCLRVCDFDDYVVSIFYGDDNITTVKSSVLQYFNGRKISEVLSRYNIVYGGVSKDGSIVEYSSIYSKETSFLKRRIIDHPFRNNIYLACMDVRAVEEICNWTFKTENLRQQSIVSCQAMLLSSYGRGKQYYDDLRHKVIAYWIRKYCKVSIPTWHEEDTRCLGSASFIEDNEK